PVAQGVHPGCQRASGRAPSDTPPHRPIASAGRSSRSRRSPTQGDAEARRRPSPVTHHTVSYPSRNGGGQNAGLRPHAAEHNAAPRLARRSGMLLGSARAWSRPRMADSVEIMISTANMEAVSTALDLIAAAASIEMGADVPAPPRSPGSPHTAP